jgi:1,4-dihydroxy-6-naphthoate synthase
MGRIDVSDLIMEPLPIGFSPCPNDTFMFGPMVRTPGFVPGVKFLPWLADIEALNECALAGEAPLAFTKLSAHGYFRAEDRYMALRTGAALGRGCGPLVVARAPAEIEALAGKRVAVPGAYTTAHLLLRCFAPRSVVPVHMRFDRIMPAVAAGEVDAGVIIHEGRFVYPAHGLVMVADLGAVWEAATGLPLPLGVIAAERGLPMGQVRAVEEGIGRSIAAAEADPAAVWAFVKAHAQELSDEVCRQHIALYVNAFSRELGDEGAAAIEELRRRGREVGALPR